MPKFCKLFTHLVIATPLTLCFLLAHSSQANECVLDASAPISDKAKAELHKLGHNLKSFLSTKPIDNSIPEPPNGCDSVYLKNIASLTSDVKESSKLVKTAVLIGTPKSAAKYGLFTVAKKVGLVAADSAIGGFIIVEGAADLLTTLEVAGFFYAENKPVLTGLSKSYQIILEAESGGGPELDRYYKELSDNNVRWKNDGMNEEIFRQILIDMDKRNELCTNVSGYTLDELTNQFSQMSDSEVSYYQKSGPADLQKLEDAQASAPVSAEK